MTPTERKFRKMAQATLANLINFFRKDLSKKQAIEQVVYNEYSNAKLAGAMFSVTAFAVGTVMLCVSIVQILAITAEALL